MYVLGIWMETKGETYVLGIWKQMGKRSALVAMKPPAGENNYNMFWISQMRCCVMPSDADARKPFTMPNGSALSLACLPRGGLAHRRERWPGEHLPDERDA